MSFVVAAPDAMSTVAQDLAGIHSSLSQVTAAATGPTTAIVAAAEDEVSAAVAALFGTFGQEYHAVGGRAAAFHEQFVGALNGAAGAYASTELANAHVAAAAGMPVNPVTPYQTFVSTTATNVETIGNVFFSQTVPALWNAAGNYPQLVVTALQTGNILSLATLPVQLGVGVFKMFTTVAVPFTLSAGVGPSGLALGFGIGLPEQIALDALGPLVTTGSAITSTSGQVLGGILTGDPLTAATAFFDAPVTVANALLNSQETLTYGLPLLPGVSLTANVPFDGLLVPLEPQTPITVTWGTPFAPLTVTGPPTRGLVTELVNYAPQALAEAFIA